MIELYIDGKLVDLAFLTGIGCNVANNSAIDANAFQKCLCGGCRSVRVSADAAHEAEMNVKGCHGARRKRIREAMGVKIDFHGGPPRGNGLFTL